MLLMAHAGEALEPHDLWGAWRFDPGVVILLAFTGSLYARGARVSRGVRVWQMICFWTGFAALAIALISPLHPLGEVLFSAHMAQHEVLMLVAAPLLVMGKPLVAQLWGLPMSWRRGLGQWSKRSSVQGVWTSITSPWAAWVIHAVALWIWHVPSLFQATLTSDLVHTAQHFSFFGSALLFWWSLFYAHGAKSYGAGVLYLFTTAVHTSILGALLTFSKTIWYPTYTPLTVAWGWTPLEDQQIGGLIMWVPGGMVYLCAAMVLFAAWLRESDVMVARGKYAD